MFRHSIMTIMRDTTRLGLRPNIERKIGFEIVIRLIFGFEIVFRYNTEYDIWWVFAPFPPPLSRDDRSHDSSHCCDQWCGKTIRSPQTWGLPVRESLRLRMLKGLNYFLQKFSTDAKGCLKRLAEFKTHSTHLSKGCKTGRFVRKYTHQTDCKMKNPFKEMYSSARRHYF